LEEAGNFGDVFQLAHAGLEKLPTTRWQDLVCLT
jgi:hypothetical protein